MKGVVCERYGPPDVLELEELERPISKGSRKPQLFPWQRYNLIGDDGDAIRYIEKGHAKGRKVKNGRDINFDQAHRQENDGLS